jgi:hypothetical protein
MRWYSAGEHLFCATSSVRRAIVSHDAIIRSVIIIGSDTVLRRLRAVMTTAFPMTSAVERFQMSDVPSSVSPRRPPLSPNPEEYTTCLLRGALS